MVSNETLLLFQQMQQALLDKIAVDVLTLVDCPKGQMKRAGQMLLLYPDGRVAGKILDERFTQQLVEYSKKQCWQQPVVFSIEHQDQMGYQIFWDRALPSHKAVILGAGHISRSLVQIMSVLDYKITVVDDRPEFANAHWFPKETEVICQEFGKALEQILPTIDQYTAAIIVTRGHQHDFTCLKALIEEKAGYLGMIGSRSRVKGMLCKLQEGGVEETVLQKIHAPIGLAIAAHTPAEIAVSIVAEIVSVLNGGHGRSMGGK